MSAKLLLIILAAFSFLNLAEARRRQPDGGGTQLSLTFEDTNTEELKAPVEILAWSWGVSYNPKGRKSRSGDNIPKGLVLQDFSLTKYIDQTSPKLAAMTSDGSSIKTVALHVNNQDKATYVLHNARVTNVSMGGSGSEQRLTENVTFTFETVDIQFNESRVHINHK